MRSRVCASPSMVLTKLEPPTPNVHAMRTKEDVLKEGRYEFTELKD